MAVNEQAVRRLVQPTLEKLDQGLLDEALALTRKLLAPGEERTMHGTPVPFITKVGEAIGEFGRDYPGLTIPFLVQMWDTRGREERFSVGHAFGEIGKIVIAHPDEAMPVLKELARDSRKFVRRASASALKDIARKHEDVANELETWGGDPDDGVREVAAVALSFAKKSKK